MKTDHKTTLYWVLAIALNLFLFYESSMSVWAWITIQDIKSWCVENNQPVDDVLYKFSRGVIEDFEVKSKDEVTVRPYDNYPLSRLGFSSYDISASSSDTSGDDTSDQGISVSVTSTSYLRFYASLSDNMVNLICVASIGFFTGLLLIGIQSLRNRMIDPFRLLIRPALGGLAAAILFLLILSGGAILWKGDTEIRSLSVGLIGILGSLYFDKIRHFIDNNFIKNTEHSC